MLIALLSGQRCQTIHALNIAGMTIDTHPIRQHVFQIHELLKTSRPGKHFSQLVLQSYPEDKELCVFDVLQTYVARTQPLRANYTQLLISYQKPHRPVTSETIARWIRKVLDNAGIDTTTFGAHSTRAAATSAAKCAKLSVNTIMNAAGWTNAATFSRFYDKPITPATETNFGHTVLKSIEQAKSCCS
jgi:hypothetical protein